MLGIVAVGMIIGCVFWLTGRIDQIERENARSIVQLMVTERVAHIGGSTGDYANWNLAYEIVTANDEEAIVENLGSGATEGGLFDQLVILNANGSISHVFDAAEEITKADQFDLKGLSPFLERLKEAEPGTATTISGVGMVNGTYAAIGLARITPDYYADLNDAALPMIAGIKLFNEESLQAISNLTKGSDYAITPNNSSDFKTSVDLAGPDGTPVAQLVWSPMHLGTILRNEIMPGILLVCFGIFAICISAARYFHKQGKALDRAMSIATTDQLTGLLNRSGLDNVLRGQHMKALLQSGHLAILYLDLNDFKQLNDEHGHKVGDQALIATAKRLREAIRPHDYVVRLGGDEFICIIIDQNPRAAAKAVSDRILITCNAPIGFSDFDMVVPPSLGISISKPGMSWDTLLGQADEAMYQAKRKKLNCAEFYSADNLDAKASENDWHLVHEKAVRR